jgi:hypothetical protein
VPPARCRLGESEQGVGRADEGVCRPAQHVVEVVRRS